MVGWYGEWFWGFGRVGRKGLTFWDALWDVGDVLENVVEMLSYSEGKQLFPECVGVFFRDSEIPCSAVDVSWVLPYGLHAFFEEMDGIFVAKSVEGEGVDGSPEALDVVDVFLHERQTAFVVA